MKLLIVKKVGRCENVRHFFVQKNKNVSSCNVLQLEKCELTYLYRLQLHQRSSNNLYFSNTISLTQRKSNQFQNLTSLEIKNFFNSVILKTKLFFLSDFFTDTQREFFFQKSQNFGLKYFEAFGVFSAKLSALFWHCESLVHGKMQLVLFPTKNFGFQV